VGRIKTKPVKRITKELFARHSDTFKKDFTENKKLVSQYADIKSKKIRNTIAGYVTKLMRTKE